MLKQPWTCALFSCQKLLRISYPRQCDIVANFWTAPTLWFQDRTGPPNSEESLCPSVTSYWCSTNHFWALDTCWKTTLKALSIEPQFSQQFFMGAWQSRWCTNSVTNFTVWILRKPVRSLDLPPSVAAFVLIVEPNAHGLHDLQCSMMFLQNFSTVATS